jgi:hypothetical protein
MPILKKIYVEITNVCNLRCDFCPPVARPPGFLSRERFGLILGKLAGKARILYFHVKGEPLLHPELGVFIDMAGDAGFEVHITTNGSLLPERIDELRGRSALRRVNISLHSIASVPETSRESTRLAILEAAEILAREDSIRVVSLRQWDSSAPDGNLVRLGAKINFHPAQRFVWPRLPDAAAGPGAAAEPEAAADFGAKGFCLALRDQAGILLDGTVVPCCLDAEGGIPLGSIYGSGWDEIMASARARALYRGFSERKIVEPLCRTCGFRTRFA